MKKIPTLFKRNYDGDRLVYNEIVEGCEWVVAGQGVATEKFDGTCCLVKDGQLYKRYDRKEKKPAPEGWIEASPQDINEQGKAHWFGWALVGDGPDDKYRREALVNHGAIVEDGTCELVGPKVQGNPYELERHELWHHGDGAEYFNDVIVPVQFDDLQILLNKLKMEGIVWHHPDGRMCKIKRRDFGFPWPIKKE